MGRGGRRGCAGLRVSMSMCLSFTPPLSAAASAAAAATAAGIAAAPSLARRRYLLRQVRSNPGGAGGAGRAAGTSAVAPLGLPRGQSWLGGSMCLPGWAASCLWVEKQPLDTGNITHTTYQCLRVKTRRSPRLAAPGRPWDCERVGAHHAVGSGWGTSSRAWHGQMRLPGRPGLRLRARGGKEEGSYLLASLRLTITTHSRTLLVISSGPCGSCRRKPGLIRFTVPVTDVWKQFALALILRLGETTWREGGGRASSFC